MATKQELAESLRKQNIAWRLHLAGASPAEIAASKDPDRADTLFHDARGAAQALRAARRRVEEEEAEDPTDVHAKIAADVATFMRLKRALWPAATAGDVAAVREIRQLTLASAQLRGYIKGADADAKPVVGDPIDDLQAKRDARRAAGT